MAATFTILGVDDEVTVCERCGKRNLKRTVALEQADDDGNTAVVRFGSDCAARALKGREKVTRSEANEVERRALRAMESKIEAELRGRSVLHLAEREYPERGVTFVRDTLGRKWGRAFRLEDGRTYLRFDFVVKSPATAEKLAPGAWIMLGESRFVGTPTP